MSAGCYVIGDNNIHISMDFRADTYSANESYEQYFKIACSKLKEKLKCLVIVDTFLSEFEVLNKIYVYAKKHADSVYIISPAVALLQHISSSSIAEVNSNHTNILVLIILSCGIQAYILEKLNNCLFIVQIETVTVFDLNMNELYQPFKPFPDSVFCLYEYSVRGDVLCDVSIIFPKMIRSSFTFPMAILAHGGMSKALCITNPLEEKLEVINFSSGIIFGLQAVVFPGERFPLYKHYSFPLLIPHIVTTGPTILAYKKSKTNLKGSFLLTKKILYNSIGVSQKNYIIEYNEFGLMKLKETRIAPFPPLHSGVVFSEQFGIWNISTKQFRSYNFSKTIVQHFTLDFDFENHKTAEDFQNLTSYVKSLSEDYRTMTILYDGKLPDRLDVQNVYVIPTYLALLEYCIRNCKIINEKVIVIISTKDSSTIYALSKALTGGGGYTVTYISILASSQSFISESIFCDHKNIDIIHLSEENPALFLFFDKNVSSKMHRLKLHDFVEIINHGALMFSTLQTQLLKIVSHMNLVFDFEPVNSKVEELDEPQKIYYEIDALFYYALNSLGTTPLFWGDLITIFITHGDHNYAYVFAQIEKKFALQHRTILGVDVKITFSLLKNSKPMVINHIESVEHPLKFDNNIKPLTLNLNGSIHREELLGTIRTNKPMNIYYTQKYKEAVANAAKNKVFDKIVFKRIDSMTIEYEGNKCRILVEDNEYLTFADDEWIPIYVSFLRETPIIANEALKDFKKSPEFVIYDIIKILGSTSSLCPKRNPFKVVLMDDSEDPKLGFKVQTQKGERICSPEMALAIYFQKLIKIFENFIDQEINEIKFYDINQELSERQKKGIESLASRKSYWGFKT